MGKKSLSLVPIADTLVESIQWMMTTDVWGQLYVEESSGNESSGDNSFCPQRMGSLEGE